MLFFQFQVTSERTYKVVNHFNEPAKKSIRGECVRRLEWIWPASRKFRFSLTLHSKTKILARKKVNGTLRPGHSFNQFVYMLWRLSRVDDFFPSNADRSYVRFITKFYHSFALLPSFGLIFIFFRFFLLFWFHCFVTPVRFISSTTATTTTTTAVEVVGNGRNSSEYVCDLWIYIEMNFSYASQSQKQTDSNSFSKCVMNWAYDVKKNALRRLRKSLSFHCGPTDDYADGKCFFLKWARQPVFLNVDRYHNAMMMMLNFFPPQYSLFHSFTQCTFQELDFDSEYASVCVYLRLMSMRILVLDHLVPITAWSTSIYTISS